MTQVETYEIIYEICKGMSIIISVILGGIFLVLLMLICLERGKK